MKKAQKTAASTFLGEKAENPLNSAVFGKKWEKGRTGEAYDWFSARTDQFARLHTSQIDNQQSKFGKYVVIGVLEFDQNVDQMILSISS